MWCGGHDFWKSLLNFWTSSVIHKVWCLSVKKNRSFLTEISLLSVSATPGPEGLVILTREAAVVPGPD